MGGGLGGVEDGNGLIWFWGRRRGGGLMEGIQGWEGGGVYRLLGVGCRRLIQ